MVIWCSLRYLHGYAEKKKVVPRTSLGLERGSEEGVSGSGENKGLQALLETAFQAAFYFKENTVDVPVPLPARFQRVCPDVSLNV